MRCHSLKAIIFLLFFLTHITPIVAQCDVKSKLGMDGTLYSFFEPVRFYWTKSANLSGGIVTDKEYYFLSLYPKPFPAKASGKKSKENLEVKLSNNKSYTLEYYYSNYQNDSIFEIMYLIDKKILNDFVEFEVQQVKMNMGGSEGIRTYNLKLHNGALKEQLNCFLKKGN